MAEQLWSDERIDIEASEATETLDGTVFVRHVIRQSLKKVRDDLQAALDAANQRIAELEAAADPEALVIAYGKGRTDGQEDCRKRIAELESQGEWEPLPDGDYTFGLPDSDYVQMIRLRRNGEDFTEWCENPSTGSTSDVDGISLYWSGFRLCRRKEAGE